MTDNIGISTVALFLELFLVGFYHQFYLLQ
jgi:hypothetical protein